MDEPFKEGEDASLRLPEEMRLKFEEHYADKGVTFSGDVCDRCGALVRMRHELHATWHKNVSLQLWLVGEWAREMMEWKKNAGEMMVAMGDLLLVELGEEPSGR